MLVAVPPGVRTRIAPVVAPRGTRATIWVGETTANGADTRWKVTAVAPRKWAPFIVTRVPTVPPPGVTELKVG